MDTNFNTETQRTWRAAEKISLCDSLLLCFSALGNLRRQKFVFISVHWWLGNFDVTILKRDEKGVVYTNKHPALGVFVS